MMVVDVVVTCSAMSAVQQCGTALFCTLYLPCPTLWDTMRNTL